MDKKEKKKHFRERWHYAHYMPYEGIVLDTTLPEKFDPMPVLTPREAVKRFLAGGQIRQNELRKVVYGNQYDCSDNMDLVDDYEAFKAEQRQYYATLRQQAQAANPASFKKESPQGQKQEPLGSQNNLNQ